VYRQAKSVVRFINIRAFWKRARPFPSHGIFFILRLTKFRRELRDDRSQFVQNAILQVTESFATRISLNGQLFTVSDTKCAHDCQSVSHLFHF
jgi:hypothetical protein